MLLALLLLLYHNSTCRCCCTPCLAQLAGTHSCRPTCCKSTTSCCCSPQLCSCQLYGRCMCCVAYCRR
jgi:hypothetical protein